MSGDVTICTIADRSFEPGCATLLNSLIAGGFRGKVVVGKIGKGHQLPEILAGNPLNGIEVNFVALPDKPNVNAHKPYMISHCFDDKVVDSVFFFDSDVVCCKEWRHFEEWVNSGIAVCSDVNFLWMPPNHPQRYLYRGAIEDLNLSERKVTGYANGGFLGVRRKDSEVVEVWQQVLDWLDDRAASTSDEWNLLAGFSKYDQDALNVALMSVSAPISFVGHEGMSFGQSVGYMVHSLGSRKPWNKGYIKELILHGRGLPLTAREFWKHADGPIGLFSSREKRLARLEMDVTAALSRVIGR